MDITKHRNFKKRNRLEKEIRIKNSRIIKKVKKAEALLNLLITKNDNLQPNLKSININKNHNTTITNNQHTNGHPPDKKRLKTNSNEYVVTNCEEIKPTEEELTRERLEEIRRKIKERQLKSMQAPKIFLKSPEFAHLNELTTHNDIEALRWSNEETRNTFPLFTHDIQHAITFLLQGNRSGFEPKWCKILRMCKISEIITIHIEGMGIDEYDTYKDTFSSFHKFPLTAEFATPLQYGKSFECEFFKVGFTKAALLRNKHNLEERDRNLGLKNRNKLVNLKMKQTLKCGQLTKLDLLMTPGEMAMEGYPLPYLKNRRTKDFIFLKDEYLAVTNNSPLFGIDCEMVHTDKGIELGQISVVNENLKCIYMSYVKPSSKVINYLTEFSGIIPQNLLNETTTLKDVQKKLKQLIPANAIIVGHSLHNDFLAMEIFHPYVIDSSFVYNLTGDRKRRSKLKYLTEIFLKRKIQVQSTSGHDPTEDAIASLELILLKLKNGADFGDIIVSKNTFVESKSIATLRKNVPDAPINVINAYFCIPNISIYESFFLIFKRSGKKAKLYERAPLDDNIYELTNHVSNCKIETFKSDKLLVKKFINDKKRCFFSYLHLQSFKNLTYSNSSIDNITYAMKKTNGRLRKILKTVSNNAVVAVIMSGNYKPNHPINNGLCLLKVINSSNV